MQATIKSIHLENFKGVKNATYQFDKKNASAIGQNGAGKTTLFTAYMWLMVDKDSDLKSNPNIRPLNTEECAPRVEVVFDIDGKEVVAEKFQKMKKKEYEKNGQKVTEISTENSYKVNHSPMGLAQYKKKMATYGFDFEKFLQLSHTDAFTNQMATKKDLEKMRDTLFEMAESYNDLQIAEMMGNVPEVAELLNVNTKDEIRATQNDALRDIRENYGKDGEILRAKIEGMEQSKTDIDVAELELQKNALNEQIDENRAKQEDISKEFEERQRASGGVIELKFELNGIQQKANEELEKKRRELKGKINDICQEIKELNNQIGLNDRDIGILEEYIKKHTSEIEKCRNDWNRINGEEMSEESVICPTCHREMPEDFKKEYVSEFEKSKKDRLALVSRKGNEMKDRIKQDNAEIEQIKATRAENEKNKEKKEEELSVLEKELEEVPQSVDISDRPEVQEIQKKIAEKEAAMNKGNSAEEIRQDLRFELNDLQNHLVEVEKQLSLARRNIEIDEQIAELRKKQSEFEQNKANAEKILYQLDLVSRKKNTLLQDDVNSHFELVDFKLFDWLKNGEYKETCVPTYRNKDMGISTNTGLEILMKLDIIRGLQKFYGMYLPVFIDGAETLSESTMKMINADCQTVFLKVTEDENLKVEVME